MFYDEAKIYVRGGDGGNGAVAFRREKYVPRGGPSGGDGGRGGSVILEADPGLRTLVDFHYRTHYRAERGEHGQGKNKHGRSAPDLVLRVPVGTVVRDAETNKILADLVYPGQQVVVAAGGRGGRGNARFATPWNQAPTFAEKGEPGEERWLLLELKLLADVGLIGLPNAGKSTLLSRISAARPKIADYPFTTLTPNLGVVRLDEEHSFVVADIPGLIEGAHRGAGLGLKFLRHIERTRILVHVLEVGLLTKEEVLRNFRIVNEELSHYSPKLLERPQVIAANKIDLPGGQENVEFIKASLGSSYRIFPISALKGEGIEPLLWYLTELLASLPETGPIILKDEYEETSVIKPPVTILRQGDVFLVSGPEVERRVAMTDFNNEAAVYRLQQALKRLGVEEALRRAGARPGDTVRIGNQEFEWQE
ncbi:GTP-binding protein [Thermanaeromonas toyohensis ToBE]|uniref:GTPase Obg n=1 Tax=Thermanaeromonas toyohensis ToBE TaxID=698762 RepID=A0A1W1VHK0_9FIRM|nr:GTPase ObgE [Thermanaeromonas toyohensis]SMB92839.1 GTP-binding protein [Thermanaeromonas toyohensis ToBE]